MRTALVALLFLPLLAALPAHADLVGSYTVAGTNQDGSPYEGTLQVVRHDAVYQFTWLAGSESVGIGLEDDETATVAFGGDECGVVMYQVGQNGTLNGRWSVYGQSAVGTEVATRTSGTGLVGTYSVQGTNLEGDSYTGSLTVTRQGDAYALAWDAAGTYVGVGLQEGQTLGATYGSEGCGVVVYRQERRALNGRWTTIGSSAVGTETATRG